MRRLKATLIASLAAASLFAAAGTAWVRSESSERGTAWTDADGQAVLGAPSGVELLGL